MRSHLDLGLSWFGRLCLNKRVGSKLSVGALVLACCFGLVIRPKQGIPQQRPSDLPASVGYLEGMLGNFEHGGAR